MDAGSLFVQHNDLKDSKVQDIDQLIKDPKFADHVMSYTKNARGSAQYWKSKSAELLSMVRFIGPPTIFFTLSAADIWYNDITRMIEDSDGFEFWPDNSIRVFNQDFINNNPVKAAWCFQKRTQLFITHVICKKFSISDFWYRFEWQDR